MQSGEIDVPTYLLLTYVIPCNTKNEYIFFINSSVVTGNTTELVVDSDQPDDFHRESDDGSFNQENGFSHTLLF